MTSSASPAAGVSSAGRGASLALASAAAFATTGILSQFAFGAGANIVSLLSGRYLLCAALLWSAVALLRLGVPARRDALLVLGLGAGLISIQSCLFFHSLQRIPPGLADMLMFVYPALVTAGAILLRREQLRPPPRGRARPRPLRRRRRPAGGRQRVDRPARRPARPQRGGRLRDVPAADREGRAALAPRGADGADDDRRGHRLPRRRAARRRRRAAPRPAGQRLAGDDRDHAHRHDRAVRRLRRGDPPPSAPPRPASSRRCRCRVTAVLAALVLGQSPATVQIIGAALVLSAVGVLQARPVPVRWRRRLLAPTRVMRGGLERALPERRPDRGRPVRRAAKRVRRPLSRTRS